MRKYWGRSEREIFIDEELENAGEFCDASEEKIVWSKNGFW